MRKSLLVLCISLGLSQNANSQTLGVAEAKMGMSVENVFKDEDVVCRSRGMIYKYTICENLISIRNKPVQAYYYFDSDRLVVISLEFDKGNFRIIKEELVEKWGQPQFDVSETASSDGQETVSPPGIEWNLPEGHILLLYDGKERDLSTACLTSNEGIEKYREKMKDYLTD